MNCLKLCVPRALWTLLRRPVGGPRRVPRFRPLGEGLGGRIVLSQVAFAPLAAAVPTAEMGQLPSPSGLAAPLGVGGLATDDSTIHQDFAASDSSDEQDMGEVMDQINIEIGSGGDPAPPPPTGTP
jgi:hypothetical protein